MKWQSRTRNSPDGSRQQIIGMLRQGEQTADDLARRLGITHSAVRVHLLRLEKENIVQRSGQRAGIRKPHLLYSLTAEAEHLFCKAYVPVLQQILNVLEDRLPPSTVEAAFLEVGRRLAAAHPAHRGQRDMHQRSELALTLYQELGGTGTLQQEGDRLSINGFNCPLAAVVDAHPRVCDLIGEFLSASTGAHVQAECDRGDFPRCRFEIRSDTPSAGG